VEFEALAGMVNSAGSGLAGKVELLQQAPSEASGAAVVPVKIDNSNYYTKVGRAPNAAARTGRDATSM